MVFQPFQPHPVFDTLRQDPAAASGLTVLIGYPTESDRGGGYRRLYLTLDLSAYVDIPSADVVGTQPLPAEQFPLGETVVWVKRDAQLHYTQAAPVSQQVQADFLHGEIARAYLPQTCVSGLSAASHVTSAIPQRITGLVCVPRITGPNCVPPISVRGC